MTIDQTQTESTPVAVTEEVASVVGPWKVVVLNDPVNLMSYVVLVLRKVFGYNETVARKHMLEVHENGRSIVWCGLREQAEHFAFILHQWHLSAVLERNETD